MRAALVAAMLVVFGATPAFAWQFDAGLGRISGHDVYDISFPGGVSELKFSFSAPVFTLGASGAAANLRASAALSLTPAPGSGTIIDTDAFSGDANPGTDIRSESRLETRYIGGHVTVMPGRFMHIAPAFRLMAAYTLHAASDTEQEGAPGYESYTQNIRGHTIDYETFWLSPLFGAFVNGRVKGADASLFVGVMPAGYAWSRDDHVLRYKESVADVTSRGALVEAEAAYAVNDGWFVGVSWRWWRFAGSGTQVQEFYAGINQGDVYRVAFDMEQELSIISVRVGREF